MLARTKTRMLENKSVDMCFISLIVLPTYVHGILTEFKKLIFRNDINSRAVVVIVK